jgi:hypothetical protein
VSFEIRAGAGAKNMAHRPRSHRTNTVRNVLLLKNFQLLKICELQLLPSVRKMECNAIVLMSQHTRRTMHLLRTLLGKELKLPEKDLEPARLLRCFLDWTLLA